MIYTLHMYLPSRGMFFIENYEELGITYTDNYKQEYEYKANLLTKDQVADWCDKCLRSIRFDSYRTYLMPRIYRLFSHLSDVFRQDFSIVMDYVCDPEDDLNGYFLEIIKVESPGDIF